MLRLNHNKSGKYLNQLAQSEELLQLERDVKDQAQRIHFKMRSLNPLAYNDHQFIPSVPDRKTLTSTTTTSPIHSEIKLVPPLNPETESSPVNIILKKTQSLPPDYANLEIISKVQKHHSQNYERLEYCLSCDKNYQQKIEHICSSQQLASMESVQKRIRQFYDLIPLTKSQKFTIFADNAYQIQNSNQLIFLIQFLKKGAIQYSEFELFLRKRLINLCSKKLGLLFEKEDSQ